MKDEGGRDHESVEDAARKGGVMRAENRHRRWLTWIILVGVLWGISLACYTSDTFEAEENSEWRYYAITPEALIKALDQDDPNAFTLMEATPTPLPSPKALPVHWNQSDFYRIAQAVHEQAWQIPLGANNLYEVTLDMYCSDAEGGPFFEADFRSNDAIQVEKEDMRLEHWTRIKPLENTVVTIAVEYRPNVNYKKPFHLEQFQITADEGVQIAENNGGSAARLRVDNDCIISAIGPGEGNDEWRILYLQYSNDRDHSGTRIYQIDINAQTGEYEVLYPQP